MTLKNLKDYRERGFTIVELLIVIVVIAILATLVITAYNGVQQRARDAKRVSDVRAIQTAAEAFQSEKGNYPTLVELKAATNTVKLDSTLTANIDVAPVTSADKDKYQYYRCGTSATAITGVNLVYYEEAGSTTRTKSLGTVSGTVGGSSVTCAATHNPTT